MRTEYTRPSRKHWEFSLLPLVGFSKLDADFAKEYSIVLALFFWGICITITSKDIDRFDEFMSNVFRMTNPQMWFTFILAFIILANLL